MFPQKVCIDICIPGIFVHIITRHEWQLGIDRTAVHSFIFIHTLIVLRIATFILFCLKECGQNWKVSTNKILIVCDFQYISLVYTQAYRLAKKGFSKRHCRFVGLCARSSH